MKAIDVLKLIDQGKLRKLEEKATDGAIYDEAVRLGDKAQRYSTKEVLSLRRKYNANRTSAAFHMYETEDWIPWVMSPYYAVLYRTGNVTWLPSEERKPFPFRFSTVNWGARLTDQDDRGVCYEGEWFSNALIAEIRGIVGDYRQYGVQSGNIQDHKMLVISGEVATAWLCPYVKEK